MLGRAGPAGLAAVGPLALSSTVTLGASASGLATKRLMAKPPINPTTPAAAVIPAVPLRIDQLLRVRNERRNASPWRTSQQGGGMSPPDAQRPRRKPVPGDRVELSTHGFSVRCSTS